MSVNEPFTPKSSQGAGKRRRYKRPKRDVETVEYIEMLGRLVRRAGERVAVADMDELTALFDLRDALDDAIAVAVVGVRDSGGYSWASIGEAAGYPPASARQAAYQRWGKKK